MNKSDEELIKEYLDNGGEVEQLPPIVEEKTNNPVGNVTKKIPNIKTLPEGEFLYGRKQKKRKKKKPDYSGIDMNHIPEHIKKKLKININVDDTKEITIEADQNRGSAEANN